MKDNTFIVIGIFLMIVFAFMIIACAIIKEASIGDVLLSIMALFMVEALCFAAHKAVNRKK